LTGFTGFPTTSPRRGDIQNYPDSLFLFNNNIFETLSLMLWDNPIILLGLLTQRIEVMGHISYLTGQPNKGPQSIAEALYKLESTSVLFCRAWQQVPPDLIRAGRESANAMEHLDHIVNEILRARDTRMAKGTYSGSQLEAYLNIKAGVMTTPVTLAQQQAMVAAGPGHGQVPGLPVQITLELLLNKIKHRHHQSANFRIQAGQHIFVINVDKQNKKPDSIAEFDVLEFCVLCASAVPHL
jgi:hypothetical protein